MKRQYLISQVDYSASDALRQAIGNCPVALSGVHDVLKGESHCARCGRGYPHPLESFAASLNRNLKASLPPV